MGWQRTILLIGALLFASVMWDLTFLDPLIIALIVVLIISWLWNKTTLSGLGIRRTVISDRVSVGEKIREEIVVSNRSRIPKLWVQLDDRSSLPNHAASRVLRLRGRSEKSWQVETVAVQRGRHRLGPVWASGSDPVGLYESSHLMPVTHDVMVYPGRVDISSITLPTAHLSGGRIAHRPAMTTTVSAGSIRDYSPGDPLNRISWSATARRGALMVKEFEPDPTSDVWILVDLNETWHRALHEDERLPGHAHLNSTTEYIVSLGFSLAEAAMALERRVGLVVNRDDPIRLDPATNERQSLRIAETLAVVTPSGARSLVESIASDVNRVSRTSGLVIITADTGGDWVSAAAGLVERLIPVTAVIVDPGTGTSEIVQRLARARVQVHRFPLSQ
ncbi:MAG: DUF58 domain-containing protein [Thermomicrobiales bacterium]|nr:DUF58 domain-containing protein [Thermomicrobiales bacterium]